MEEISIGDAGDVTTFDTVAWPLCTTLSQQGTTWLSPAIPQPALTEALTNYLDLAADEVLLAIVANSAATVATQSCALTTKRIYWSGNPRADVGTWVDPDRPTPQSVGTPPVRCEYVAYKDLPTTVAL